MTQTPSAVLDLDVTTHGKLPGAEDYVRTKLGGLGRVTRLPVLYAHVKLGKHADPAVANRVIAQANFDVNGRVVRAQVEGVTAREAIDRLEARLRRQLERLGEHREANRDRVFHAESAHRPTFVRRPEEDSEIIRHKSFSLATNTVDEAVFDMESLDYDFHLFTEAGTGQDSVLYRGGSADYRLAQVDPQPQDKLAPFQAALTISPQPAPRIPVEEAIQRMGLLGLPFLFFVDAARDRGSVLYHRYDGHYGLITPAG